MPRRGCAKQAFVSPVLSRPEYPSTLLIRQGNLTLQFLMLQHTQAVEELLLANFEERSNLAPKSLQHDDDIETEYQDRLIKCCAPDAPEKEAKARNCCGCYKESNSSGCGSSSHKDEKEDGPFTNLAFDNDPRVPDQIMIKEYSTVGRFSQVSIDNVTLFAPDFFI
jgi:hypothetical protein